MLASRVFIFFFKRLLLVIFQKNFLSEQKDFEGEEAIYSMNHNFESILKH